MSSPSPGGAHDARLAITHDFVARLSSKLDVRLFGGGAIALHCYWEKTYGSPREIRDVDLVASRSDFRSVAQLIENMGGKIDWLPLSINENRLARGEYSGLLVDLYSDPLYLNQTIYLGARLTRRPLTLSTTDLLITKLQIEQTKESDLLDIVAILSSASMRDNTALDFVEQDRIVDICTHNWGFYYTATRRLAEAHLVAKDASHGARLNVIAAADQLSEAIKVAKKGLGWRIRNKIGTRLSWYHELEPS